MKNSLYEEFNCKNKEELYEKIRNQDEDIKPLMEFFDYAKANIKNNRQAISNPDTLVDYVKSITLPTTDVGTIIFANTKNQPVHHKRTRLSQSNSIKETLREGLMAGANNVFLAFSNETPNKRIEETKGYFEKLGMTVLDTISYSKENNSFRSTVTEESYYPSKTYEIASDGEDTYGDKDYSLKDKYVDFASYFASNELVNLNVVENIDEIKEVLKIGFQHHQQEIFGIIVYDSNENILGAEELFKGAIDRTIVDLKIIAKSLFNYQDVKGMAVFHNHPSGKPTPSSQDIEITNQIKNLTEIFEIELLDHFIVGKEKTLSFLQEVDSFHSGNRNYQVKTFISSLIQEESKIFLTEEELEICRKIIPANQYAYTLKLTQGVEGDFYKQKLKDIAKITHKMTTNDELVNEDGFHNVAFHYFVGNSDFYISQLYPDGTAFGYTILNGDVESAEWGYQNIEEIINVSQWIEMDYYVPEGMTIERMVGKKYPEYYIKGENTLFKQNKNGRWDEVKNYIVKEYHENTEQLKSIIQEPTTKKDIKQIREQCEEILQKPDNEISAEDKSIYDIGVSMEFEKEKRIELQRNEIFRNNVLKFENKTYFDSELLEGAKLIYPQHNNFLLKEEFVDLLQKGRNAKVEVYYENWDFEEVEVEKNINYLPKNFNEKEPTMIAPLNKGSICNEINIDSFTIKTSYDYDFLDDKPSSLLYSQNNYYTDCVIIEKNREDIKVYDGLEIMDNDDLLRIVEDEHEGLSVHGDNYYSNFELYSSLLGKDGEKIKWKINKEFKENIKKDLTQDILKVAGSIISKKTDWEKHCLNCYFNDNGIITKEKTIQLFQSWKEEAQKELNKDMKVEKNKSQDKKIDMSR